MPLQSIKVISSLFCWILLVCPLKNVSCCGSMRNLTVDEGKDAILQVNQTLPQLSFITWNFVIHIIAVTGPGQPLHLGEYSYRYLGRLFSFSDGSLVITGLTADDEKIYRVELFDEKGLYQCVQLYDVRLDENTGISPNVDPLEACTPTQQLFSRLGESVMLKLPNRPNVTRAYWDINNIDHIAITRPGGIMYRHNSSYHGKASVLEDGSLRLSNLTSEDQNIYRAELFTSQWDHLCTQHYDVRLKKLSGEPLGHYGLENLIRLGLSAAILLAILTILIYHFKTENS
ncbi:uncharacterized protein RB166_014942 [Leptodactylus fuscus]